MLKILIADDHPLTRSGVRATVAAAQDLEVVAEARSFAHIPEILAAHLPDLMILDVEMPGGKAGTAIDEAVARFPTLKVLILSAHRTGPLVTAVLKEKINGYILKSEAPELLLQAIRSVSSGSSWFSHEIRSQIQELAEAERENPLCLLSAREKQIYRILTLGKDNASIASELKIARATVRNTLGNVYAKLGVSNRIEAILFASKRKLFQEPPVASSHLAPGEDEGC